jgi:hypothetical protein
MLTKIRFMVNKILSKAQRSLLALGMIGTTITASPKKDGEFFTDMHAYASDRKEPVKPSWHLNVAETSKPDRADRLRSSETAKLVDMDLEEEKEVT